MNYKIHVSNSSRIITEIIIITCCCLVLVFQPISISINHNKSYGDGLSEEQLPPFTMDGKRLVLYTKISPTILTAQNPQDMYIEVKLIDYDAEETVQNVSYLIILEKDNRQLINYLFRSELGPLRITIEPFGSTSRVTNFTSYNDGIWDSKSGNITIQGPILLDSGLYHFSIGVLASRGSTAISRTNNMTIISNTNISKFDSWLSVGDQTNNHFVSNGTKYNVTIISYYDKIKDFKFIPQGRIFSWEIPFDWNVSRIINQSIIVHQEIKIPQTFSIDGRFFEYNATVNDMPLGGRSVAIDPFSSKNSTIVHLLINKQEILALVKERKINAADKIMVFTLSPSPQKVLESSKDLVTDKGGVYISLTWMPKELKPNTPYTMYLKFLNADNSPLLADITYGIKILDERRNIVIDKSGQTSLFNQNGSQQIVFPSNGRYVLQIYVEGLSPLSSDSLDISRNGVARGFLVVR